MLIVKYIKAYKLLEEMLPDCNTYKFVKYDLQQNDFYIRDKVLS